MGEVHKSQCRMEKGNKVRLIESENGERLCLDN